MTQAFPLRQLIHRFQESTVVLLKSDSFQQLQHWFAETKGTMLGLGVLLALLLWNWLLLLALLLGAVVLVSVYMAHQGELSFPIGRLWHRSNRSLTLATAAGAVATISTYVTAAVWQETGGSWLTVGMILQGFVTLAVLLLLVGQMLNQRTQKSDRAEQRLEAWLNDLAHPDPLKRLIAVRQITRTVGVAAEAESLNAAHLSDCFRLMLDRETEPMVCSALLESLRTLNIAPSLQPDVTAAISVKRSVARNSVQV